MEGFEHGNKVTKNITLRQTSDGGKKQAITGIRFHRQAQALQKRREGTEAAYLEGRINLYSSATRLYLKSDGDYKRKWDITDARQELEVQKVALIDLARAQCEACETCDAASSSAAPADNSAAQV
eukprot:6208790-Pleurochrysis_carterae.AAC.1